MRDDQSPVLFVSHHSSKLATAEHVEKALSARGVKCWIAPRDVDPGEPFDRAVHKAIGATDAMLLLFCSRSEKSRHVKRELILADQLNKAIIPLRLERIDPGELSYHLADSQWIDWLEQRDDVIDRIAAKAREFSREGQSADAPPAPDGPPPLDLPDAAPPHFAAVGAASDLQPHALGGFAGPGGAGFGAAPPADPPHPGGYAPGLAPAPPMPPSAGAPRRSSKWVWIGLGSVVVLAGVILAIVLAGRGSGGGMTAEWFAGVWADTRDCREPYRFDRSGQLTLPNAMQARWSIENGDTLVVEANGNSARKHMTRISDDEVRSDEGASTYRCFPGAT